MRINRTRTESVILRSTIPHAEDSWIALLETIRFARDYFERWMLARMLPKDLGLEVVAELHKQHEQYKLLSSTVAEAPSVVGIVAATNAEADSVRAFRCWKFLEHKIGELKLSKRLSLSQFHALEIEVAERLSAVTRRLSDLGIQASALEATCVVQAVVVDDDSRASDVDNQKSKPTASESDEAHSVPQSKTHAAAAFERQAEAQAKKFVDARKAKSAAAAAPEALPRRNLLEIVLDPRSIQWLLGLGGGLMVVGLVILLWINEFFTPPIMAVSLGLINLAVLAVGFCLIRFTRSSVYYLVCCPFSLAHLFTFSMLGHGRSGWTKLPNGALWEPCC